MAAVKNPEYEIVDGGVHGSEIVDGGVQGSFSGWGAYMKALRETPKRLKERAAATCTLQQEALEMKERSGADMKRKLEWYDVVVLGIGGMLGSGVFVGTGQVAAHTAGPAVILAYVVAGVSALLSALCYTEFAVEMPVAGGAFSYLRITFGEFTAYIAGANLVLEYVLSNASVARSFTSYFSSVFGVENSDSWRIHVDALPDGYNSLDLVAAILVIILTVFLCLGTKESSVLNIAITVLHLLLFGFIIVAGFAKGDIRNLARPANPHEKEGFFPFGVMGVFNGAAIVFFSYIGFDAVSTMAEEIRRPTISLPLGISGSVVIVSIIYCLMSLALCLMVPYDHIDAEDAFTDAMKGLKGWEWGTRLVGTGATVGIVASLIAAMLGQARYFCAFARAHLIPSFLARVDPRTRTPLNATASLGICTAAIALFTDLDVLLGMMSIGILLVFYMVANALIFRRYVERGFTSSTPTIIFLVVLSALSAAFSVIRPLNFEHKKWFLMACGMAFVVSIGWFKYRVPIAHYPKEWGVAEILMPWLPAASIFLNVFLLSTLDKMSYLRFVVWTGIATLYYIFYSVHSSYDTNSLRSNSNSDTTSTSRAAQVELTMPCETNQTI